MDFEGPGYTIDPYANEGTSPFFIGTILSKFTGGDGGFLSDYREWHIFLAAINAGIRAPILGNVPECPPLWWDEKHYWDLPSITANVIKCNMPLLLTAIGLKATGVI